MNINFSEPDITQKEIDNVVEVLKSGWITTGPKVKLFEQRIAKYVGTNKAVCLNSATACLELILRILGIGEGDEVITSAYTYTASASVVQHVGAKLVLVDVAKDSFEMDYEALEKAITANTKAVIPVDIAGVPCDYNKIFEIVERKKHLFNANSKLQAMYNRVIVISDSAHAFGAEYNGEKIGKRNDIIVNLAQKGVTTNVHYKPLPMMTAYKDMGFNIKDYPNAYDMYKNEISLPLYTLLTDEEVAYVIENVINVLEK